VQPIIGILLAAGKATRFGAPKLLAPLPDGTPLGVAAARRLRAVLPDTVAIVRPGDEALSALLRKEGIDVLPCATCAEGMSASLRSAIEARSDAAGWLVALADMPAIKVPTVAAVHAALVSGAQLAAPFHQGRQGHPVGFAASLRDELLALHGDHGARAVLERHAAQLARINVNDPGILRDIDTPADLPTS
jgi:molybdenum cofactor cytidylyltransferase